MESERSIEKKTTLSAVRTLLRSVGYDDANVDKALGVLESGQTSDDVPHPLLLNQKEAASMLGVSRDTIYRMKQAGEIQTVKIRGSIWYQKADLLALAQGRGAG